MTGCVKHCINTGHLLYFCPREKCSQPGSTKNEETKRGNMSLRLWPKWKSDSLQNKKTSCSERLDKVNEQRNPSCDRYVELFVEQQAQDVLDSGCFCRGQQGLYLKTLLSWVTLFLSLVTLKLILSFIVSTFITRDVLQPSFDSSQSYWTFEIQNYKNNVSFVILWTNGKTSDASFRLRETVQWAAPWGSYLEPLAIRREVQPAARHLTVTVRVKTATNQLHLKQLLTTVLCV